MTNLKELCLVYRAKHNISRTVLAKMAGVSLKTINKIENGNENYISQFTETKMILFFDGVNNVNKTV